MDIADDQLAKFKHWANKMNLLGSEVIYEVSPDGISILNIDVKNEKLAIPEGVVSIYKLSNYSNLKELILPQTIKRLPERLNLIEIGSISIPKSLKSLPNEAFSADEKCYGHMKTYGTLKIEFNGDISLEAYSLAYRNLYIKGSKFIRDIYIRAFKNSTVRTNLNLTNSNIGPLSFIDSTLSDVMVKFDTIKSNNKPFLRCLIGKVIVVCNTEEEKEELLKDYKEGKDVLAGIFRDCKEKRSRKYIVTGDEVKYKE